MNKSCRLVSAPLLLALTFGLTACASVPKPEAEIAVARTAIQGATQADAGKFANASLQRARESLERAERAVNDDEFGEARRLAERAAADAQLAESEAELVKTRQALSEVEKGIETLRREGRTSN